MDLVRNIIRAVKPLPDGDFADRLNYCYTSTLFIVLSAFISGWSFVGSPIQCWFPAYYKGWWIEYALDYCYVQNTYFLPFTTIKPNDFWDITEHIIPIPHNITERDNRLIGYYQWIPFILALQSLIFYAPVALWRAVYSSNGTKVRAICEACSINSNMLPDVRLENIDKVASFIACERKVDDNLGGRLHHATSGYFLVVTYAIVKFLYTANAILQFFLIKKVLGVKSIWWGMEVFIDLMSGREWPETGNFPRVTLCDFSVRVLGNLHRHTVQCVLMINMFNEKIFIFLWFWLFFVAVVSLISFLYWITICLINRSSRSVVYSYIDKYDESILRNRRQHLLVNEFITENLRSDGLFLIRLIQYNSGDIVTYELIINLWRKFIANRLNPPPYLEPLLDEKRKLNDDDF